MTMTHPGMPLWLAITIFVSMAAILVIGMATSLPTDSRTRFFNLTNMPVIGALTHLLTKSPWVIIFLKYLSIAVFILVIVSGLFGTPIAQRNFATVITWNVWWTLIIISVFFVGSAWCSFCPWDSIANFMVKGHLWRRAEHIGSMGLTVPRIIRNIWPALILLVGLTWLELGIGVSVDPMATASMALFMLVISLVSLTLFQRKAFCRYFCPVGRTIGSYSQLAPIEIRPVDADVCAKCTTLECYFGSKNVEPCPTNLTMGRFAQNTYCISCGNCAVSCPEHNVNWRLRSTAAEARINARPHWDEAWFMLGLLALASFHGLTMLPFWENWMLSVAQIIGDSGRMLVSFSILFTAYLSFMVGLYGIFVYLTQRLAFATESFRCIFSNFSFALLPIAFSYHLSHNLNHLMRESGGLYQVVVNPFGLGNLNRTSMNELLSSPILNGMQAVIMIWGFWITIQIIHHRGSSMSQDGQDVAAGRLALMVMFVTAITVFNVWLLMQDMVMRM